MKKQLLVILVLISVLVLPGCEKFKKIEKKLEIKEMRAITELATVECYFHNVARSDQESESFLRRDMRFWVEYEGVVRIGVDASKIKMTVEGETVRITIPEAEVLDVKVNPDSLNSESFYYDPKARRPDANQQTQAFQEANNNMREEAEKNNALLMNARENAKELLENYVKTIGEATGIQYTIEWIYPEDSQ